MSSSMHRIGRRFVATTAAAAVVLATMLFSSSSPAYAHDRSSAIYYGCGSGFRIANDGIRQIFYGSERWGEVILTYKASTGQNCVVTRKIRYHGEARYTGAYIQLQGESSWRSDRGYFAHWAAIKAYASGTCVRYWGIVSNRRSPDDLRHVTAEGGRGTFGNCG